MRNIAWKKSIPIMIALFTGLSFANMAVDAEANASSDMAITAQVQAKLKMDNHLVGSKISVDTKDGEVTLKGVVNSLADIDRAAELAGHVDGVKRVDNRLKRDRVSSSGASTYGGSSRQPIARLAQTGPVTKVGRSRLSFRKISAEGSANEAGSACAPFARKAGPCAARNPEEEGACKPLHPHYH